MKCERAEQQPNPSFSDVPITQGELAALLLAEAVHVGIRNPKLGGPRGQNITWVDTWWPQANRCVERLRRECNRGVLCFDQDQADGMYQ